MDTLCRTEVQPYKNMEAKKETAQQEFQKEVGGKVNNEENQEPTIGTVEFLQRSENWQQWAPLKLG